MMTKEKISSETVQHARVPAKRMRGVAFAILTLAAVCLMLTAPVGAANIYVDSQNGDYKTLDAAIQAASAGDTIILRAGEHYAVESHQTLNGFFIYKNDIVIKGEGNTSTYYHINLKDEATQSVGFCIYANNITFENFTIVSDNDLYDDHAFINPYGDNFVMKGCTVNVTQSEADEYIFDGDGAGNKNITIQDSTFINSGSALMWTVYAGEFFEEHTKLLTFTGNTITGNFKCGLDQVTGNYVVSGNTFNLKKEYENGVPYCIGIVDNGLTAGSGMLRVISGNTFGENILSAIVIHPLSSSGAAGNPTAITMSKDKYPSISGNTLNEGASLLEISLSRTHNLYAYFSEIPAIDIGEDKCIYSYGEFNTENYVSFREFEAGVKPLVPGVNLPGSSWTGNDEDGYTLTISQPGTYKLTDSFKLASGITINGLGGDFTLDGSGYSVMPTPSETNLGYQAVYFNGPTGVTYTLKNITFKDFGPNSGITVVLRLDTAEKFTLNDVTFENCDVSGGSDYASIMRVFNTNLDADNLTIQNCKGKLMMDIGPSSNTFTGKIVIKNSTFNNNIVSTTALIYTKLNAAEDSYLSINKTTFKNNVIGVPTADTGRGVIHLSSNAYIDGCTFDNNTVYGTHASNVNYGINSYSTGYNLKYTNNIFRNSAAYQTNGTAGSVSGLSMMATSTLNVEGNTVENSNKFFHRATVDAEFTEQQVRSVGSYSTTYGLTNIISGTYYGALSTYAGDKSIVVYGGTFSTDPKDYLADGYVTEKSGDLWVVKKYVAPSKPSSPTSKPKPVEPEIPVEPETPVEPVVGEPTVETEVTDGGEVIFEAPVEPETPGEGTPSDEPAEPAITGVVLPTGTDSEVTFIPISEQAAPAGKETQTKKVFEINVPTYEKGKPATIKFTMTVAELEADGKTAGEVALWHFDEETGEWTKLLTSYTIVDGIVYFEAITYDFSPFAIIYEETPVDEPVEEPETPATPAPVLAVFAALGAAVVLRRK